MSHAEIVATYSDKTLTGIIGQLSRLKTWPERLAAAKAEQAKRKIKNLQQDKLSTK